MNKRIDQIDRLDIDVFRIIHSQTTDDDKRSLLAVQRATARNHNEYVYLEIGSHLGGSIQPHLVDARCTKIYSIDSRPSQQNDDRSPGCVVHFEKNTSERMVGMLSRIKDGDSRKIECFDSEVSKVDSKKIIFPPHIAFIDGEHTKKAVLSDFQFCHQTLHKAGTIVFHDFTIVYPAILAICQQMDKKRIAHVPLKLGGEVFAIFFDPDLVHTDPYLKTLYRRKRYFLLYWQARMWLKKWLPAPLLSFIRRARGF
ncbi:MAG: class I SAM-dependent methyltransferase [Elusimicrobia bacterium]|nr:class I SAM-dependent methyltransferase [Elusimicrobiota bacterium]